MKRTFVLVGFFLAFTFVLILRLFYLQVYCHEELAAKADAQEFRTVDLAESARGAFRDRNGDAITADRETTSLLVVPALVDDPEDTASVVGRELHLSTERLLSKMVGETQNGSEVRKEPFVAKSNLTSAEKEKVEVLACNGVYVVSRQGRYDGDFPAQHLIGSLGTDPTSGKTVGISGLERIYDDILFADGSKKISFLVDERNRMISPGEYYITETEKRKTGSVNLTIDLGIQRAAESALAGHSGAVVVLDSENGDVLALAGAPKYDPYQTTEPLSDDVYVNKDLSAYPPASLFKIFVSAVAVEEGIAAPETMFFCDGAYHLKNGASVACWKPEGHGFITFDDALSLSCNPVFVKTAVDLGKSRMEKAFSRWELDADRLLGYPLNDLSTLSFSGVSDADLANIALGENGVKMTPLNVAKMINVIASGGLLYTPRVVNSVCDRNGDKEKVFEEALAVRVISQSTADTITSMMAKTFQSGTAEKLNLESFHIAGKTGTSETGNVWIGGFFPYENPRYTIVILVTQGSSGVGDGGPVLKKLCAYLGNLS